MAYIVVTYTMMDTHYTVHVDNTRVTNTPQRTRCIVRRRHVSRLTYTRVIHACAMADSGRTVDVFVTCMVADFSPLTSVVFQEIITIFTHTFRVYTNTVRNGIGTVLVNYAGTTKLALFTRIVIDVSVTKHADAYSIVTVRVPDGMETVGVCLALIAKRSQMT